MTDLLYPTIDLFQYDFISGLSDTTKVIQESQATFARRLPKEARNYLKNSPQIGNHEFFKLLPDSIPSLSDLTQGIWKFSGKPNKTALSGYYYPISLSDSYGLLLDCSTESVTEPQPITILKDIKAEIIQRIEVETPTIGETWLVSAYLSPSDFANAEQIAQECYKILMPNFDWREDYDGQGKFLGAAIVELSHQKLDDSSHVIIILYPDRATQENLSGKFLNDWMNLFYYRHKMFKCYVQSRFILHNIKSNFRDIEEVEEAFTTKLDQAKDLSLFRALLTKSQKALHSYTIGLPNLSLQRSTIEINLGNYHKRLEKMSGIAQKTTTNETDLNSFNIFSERVEEKYLLQIEKDIDNLEIGLRLLEDQVNTFRNQLELEKAEREKTFQQMVTVIGAGTAVTSLLDEEGEKCQSFAKMLPKNPECPPFFGFFFPMFSLFIFGMIALWIKRHFLEKR